MRTAVLAAALLLATSAHALVTHWEPELTLAVDVRINDQVSDGCWPRPNATRDAVELVFRGAGILVTGDSERPYIVTSPGGETRLYSWQELFSDMPIEEREKLEWRFAPVLEIAGLGYETSATTCAIVVTWRLMKVLELKPREAESNPGLPTLAGHPGGTGLVVFEDGQVLLTGPKANMQDRITANAKEAATSLANAILKAREEAGR